MSPLLQLESRGARLSHKRRERPSHIEWALIAPGISVGNEEIDSGVLRYGPRHFYDFLVNHTCCVRILRLVNLLTK